MDTKRQLQLELFKFQKSQPVNSKKDRYRPNFFAFIKLYEKAISIVIIFFITSLISFSTGVEKGKRLTADKTQSRKEQAQPRKPTAERVLATAAPIEDRKDILEYTIQVATFKTKTYAQKEAKRLEKRGIKALIIPRGNFACVCVGSFHKKHKARGTLNQLKKTYQDCFIRRL
jgi:cell division protein FtsN